MYFSGLKQRDYLILISILLLLIIYSIWQFYPEIFRHNNDLAMIRYFDPLEFSIFNGVWASYKHPFQYPIISGTIYPMLYYKLVSTMTFPIMYVKGDSIRILDNAVRLGGLASMIALFMVIALYSRQIFRSFLPGIITILLILSGGTNKGTIFGFFMSFRPNPFEFLMLFLAFYSLSIYFMNKSVKYLFYGIIFSSLCFSTKMDGIFLFPIISYLLYHSIINGEINFIKARKTFRYISNLFSILLFCTIPILTFSAYYFLFKRINEVTAHTVYETAGSVFVYKVAAFVILFSIIFLIAGIFIILLEKNMQKRVSSTLTINKGFMNFYILINSIITICAVYAGVFVLSNPYFITDPIKSFSFFKFMNSLFFTAKSLTLEIKFQPFYVIVLIRDLIGTMKIIPILVVIIAGLGTFFLTDKTKDHTKSSLYILLSYAMIKLVIISLTLAVVEDNYVFSEIIVIYLFFGYSIHYIIKNNTIKYITTSLLFLILLPILYEKNNPELYCKSVDAIYDIPKWIDKNVPADKVVSSCNFYLSGRYKDNIMWLDDLYKIKPNTSSDYIIMSDLTLDILQNQCVNIPTLSKNTNQLLTILKNNYEVAAKINNRSYIEYPDRGKYIYIFKKKSPPKVLG